jgi:hypothetical protein
MAVMKRIYTDAQDAFDRYSRDTFGFEPSPLMIEHREMFVTGYVQAVLDEVTKRNQQENTNDAS